jgi:hypothetical protein
MLLDPVFGVYLIRTKTATAEISLDSKDIHSYEAFGWYRMNMVSV